MVKARDCKSRFRRFESDPDLCYALGMKKKHSQLIDTRELHEEWMKKPGYRAAYAALDPEFELAGEMIKARVRAGMTQEEVAARMGTTLRVLWRLESGKRPLNIKRLEQFALATGSRIHLSFLPIKAP